jgi:hypothetical protein
MAEDHGPSVKSDSRYEGLRRKGMRRTATAQEGTHAQKVAAGRRGTRKSGG